MGNRLQGQRVMVTGASSGIGLATARAFVAEGAEVVITSEREADLLNAAEEIRKEGGKVTPLLVDFTRPEQVADLWSRAEKQVGDITILVNNAGVGLGNAIPDIREKQLRFVFEVNFFALFSLCQQALVTMSARGGGRIINLTSASARIGLGGVGAYTASKGACHTFTSALRLEAHATGVWVSEVLPISVRTPFFDRVEGEKYQPKGVVQTPEQVAQSIVRCARARRPRAEVLPYLPVRLAFIVDAILPGLLDRFMRGKSH